MPCDQEVDLQWLLFSYIICAFFKLIFFGKACNTVVEQHLVVMGVNPSGCCLSQTLLNYFVDCFELHGVSELTKCQRAKISGENVAVHYCSKVNTKLAFTLNVEKTFKR